MGGFAGIPGFPHRDASFAQLPVTGTSPLFPLVASQPAPYPLVDVPQRAQHFGNAEVRFPTKQGLSQLGDDVDQATASGTACQVANSVFELVQ